MAIKDIVSAKKIVNHYENNKSMYKIFLLFLISRILFYLFYFSINAISVIEYDAGSVYLQYDGQHYYNIAVSGYTEDYQYAFFPLFPLAIKVFGLVGIPVLGGILFNHALTLVAAYLFYFIGHNILDKSETECLQISRLWLFSPIAISTCILYSEALFVVLTLITYYCYMNCRYFKAGIALGLAIATRSLGATLFITIFLVMAYRLFKEGRWRGIVAIIKLYVPATILALAYPLYLYLKLGNWHYFIDVQYVYWGRVRTNIFEAVSRDLLKFAHPSILLILTYISLAICVYILYNAFITKEDPSLLIYLTLTILFIFSTERNIDYVSSASYYRYFFGCSAVYLLVNKNLQTEMVSIVSLLLCVSTITFICFGAFFI